MKTSGKYVLKYVLDESGNPVPCDDLMAWAQWFEASGRRVARDVIGESEVSTVFLGMNHNYGEGPPLLFETMIFGGPQDSFQRRYSTRKEAMIGHRTIVELLKKRYERSSL